MKPNKVGYPYKMLMLMCFFCGPYTTNPSKKSAWSAARRPSAQWSVSTFDEVRQGS